MIIDDIGMALYHNASTLIEARYPKGWGGAAAIRTESGNILTSVAPDVKNDGLSLCMEVGAYLEANKLNEVVTHSLCIYRENESGEYLILSPCGMCQERLVHWGGDVEAAITTEGNTIVFKTLRELMPHHWSLVNGKVL